MILYGRDLSPFARRIAVMCALQGRALERNEILVTGADFDRVKEMNPVGRVPVLELDDGTRLVESYAMGDWLDETSPNGVRFLPQSGPARRDAWQRLAVGSGTAEKAVGLVYERNRRPEEYHWMEWQQRLVAQIKGGLASMDASAPTQGWSGETGPDAGDIAAVIAFQFIEITNPWVLDQEYPGLKALAARAMELPAFADTLPSM